MLWLIKDGEILGTTDNPELDWEGYSVKDGPDAAAAEVYLNAEGEVARRSPQPSSNHYWDAGRREWLELPAASTPQTFDWAALRLSFEESQAWERIGSVKPLRAARMETTFWQFGENPQLLPDIQRQWNATVVAAEPTAAELEELRSLLSDLFAYLEQAMEVELAIGDDGSLTF